uniref:Uncharacterized protein n=1 Tax=Anguilla anguilla TaxID=7936 RepID=A0A0E9XER3_ANGAN
MQFFILPAGSLLVKSVEQTPKKKKLGQSSEDA